MLKRLFFTVASYFLISTTQACECPNLNPFSAPNGVRGFTTHQLAPVADLFSQRVENGLLGGGAFSVVHEGCTVVDLWGGVKNSQGEFWDIDTKTNLFSAGKSFIALSGAILSSNAGLNYNRKVSYYWPEFASQGKGDITVGEYLSHRGSTAALDVYISAEDTLDPEYMNYLCANITPPDFWPPTGQIAGYHPVWANCFEYLYRKVDPLGRGIKDIIQEEVLTAEELKGVQVLYRPQVDDTTIAEMMNETARDLYNYFSQLLCTTPDPIAEYQCRVLVNPLEVGADVFNLNNATLRANYYSPASNTYATARDLAKIHGLLSNTRCLARSGVLSPGQLNRASRLVYYGYDIIRGSTASFSQTGWMYGHGNPYGSLAPNPNAYGHSGLGGQKVVVDTDHKLGIAYIQNWLTFEDYGNADTLINKTYHLLGFA